MPAGLHTSQSYISEPQTLSHARELVVELVAGGMQEALYHQVSDGILDLGRPILARQCIDHLPLPHTCNTSALASSESLS